MTMEVAIICDDVTKGYALRVASTDGSEPRYLLPIRHGKIQFAEPLGDDAILIAAEEGRARPGRSRQFFLATVDAATGQIIKRSAPFDIGHWTRFLVTRDRGIVFASKGYGDAFLCWRADTLDLIARFDLMREMDGTISFDHHERYYEVVQVAPLRHELRFHSEALKQEYESQKEQFASRHDVRAVAGQVEDGSIALPLYKRVRVPDKSRSSGWSEKIEDDGFLLIDPATWTARRAANHGALVKKMSEAAHKEVFDDTRFDGLAAATITVLLNGQSHADYMAALEEIANRLRSGVDSLRFGNSLNVALKLGDRTIGEPDFFRLIVRYIPKQKEEYEERVRLLESVVKAFTDSIATGRAEGLLEGQLYSGNEEYGVPALSAFVSAYLSVSAHLSLNPASLDAVRVYVGQLDREHCNDGFLSPGTRFHLLNEHQLRVALMSQIYRWQEHDWNHRGALDAAARGLKPEAFHKIFEEELEKRLNELRADGLSGDKVEAERGRHRFNLLNSLRDKFDSGLRQLLAPDEGAEQPGVQ